jgi:hypothetical protein
MKMAGFLVMKRMWRCEHVDFWSSSAIEDRWNTASALNFYCLLIFRSSPGWLLLVSCHRTYLLSFGHVCNIPHDLATARVPVRPKIRNSWSKMRNVAIYNRSQLDFILAIGYNAWYLEPCLTCAC